MEKLQSCGNNREKLICLMAEIDAEKRSLKSRLSRISSEHDGKFGAGRERQVQIRKIRDKEGFLTEEREAVRSKLGSLKIDIKSLNKATSNHSVDFRQAFMAASERLLTEEQFLEIELKASELMVIK